jgi:hypothetical protein
MDAMTTVDATEARLETHEAVCANEDARAANAQEVAQHAFYCATPQGNLMDGLYADLKLQIGFEDAQDC